MTARTRGQAVSQILKIEDEWIAFAVDQAAMLALEHLEGEKQAEIVNRLVQGTAAKVLNAFAGGESDSPVFVNGPEEKNQPSSKSRGNEGTPVYVDGEYRGNGESIPMTKEEFIKRTVAPPQPPSGNRWWITTGTPLIVNYDDPDVV